MTRSITVRWPGSGGLVWWPAAWTGSRPSSPPGTHHSRGHGCPGAGGSRWPRACRTGPAALSHSQASTCRIASWARTRARGDSDGGDRVQGLVEGVDLAGHGGLVQAGQALAGDAAAGEQDRVAAVGADVEDHHGSLFRLRLQLLGGGRQREGGEPFQAADVGQQLGELRIRLAAIPDRAAAGHRQSCRRAVRQVRASGW